MKIKARRHTKLTVTFEGSEKFTLKPGFYLADNAADNIVVFRGRPCITFYVYSIHTDTRNYFNERGSFYASREVLARIFASKDIVIF